MSAEPRRLRLNPERESAILDAVRDLIAEIGYDAMRIDQVAARARASKATIYRRWDGKPGLAMAVMHRLCGTRRDLAESSGDLRADLIEVMVGYVSMKQQDDAFIAGMGTAFHRDAELRDRVREDLVQPFRDAVAKALRWAVERGELAPEVLEHRLVSEVLPAMCMRRKWMVSDQSDLEFFAELVDTLLFPMLRGLGQFTAAASAR